MIALKIIEVVLLAIIAIFLLCAFGQLARIADALWAMRDDYNPDNDG